MSEALTQCSYINHKKDRLLSFFSVAVTSTSVVFADKSELTQTLPASVSQKYLGYIRKHGILYITHEIEYLGSDLLNLFRRHLTYVLGTEREPIFFNEFSANLEGKSAW